VAAALAQGQQVAEAVEVEAVADRDDDL
jgi:hypothetical protein